jgi:hypothetical protein
MNVVCIKFVIFMLSLREISCVNDELMPDVSEITCHSLLSCSVQTRHSAHQLLMMDKESVYET